MDIMHIACVAWHLVLLNVLNVELGTLTAMLMTLMTHYISILQQQPLQVLTLYRKALKCCLPC